MKTFEFRMVRRFLAYPVAVAMAVGMLCGCSSGTSGSGAGTSPAVSDASGASSEDAVDSTSGGSQASESLSTADGSAAFVDPSNLTDGEYSIPISLSGGTGKVTLMSPARLTVSDGAIILTFIWSSKNYDYMRVGDSKYLPISAAGEFSTFDIPLSQLTEELTVYADTVAMSTPHEIEYVINLDTTAITAGAPDTQTQSSEGTCAAQGTASGTSFETSEPLVHDIPAWFQATDSMKLEYAHEYSVDKDAQGRAYICIGTDQKFLLLPEGVDAPEGVSSDVTIIQQPVTGIYAASSSSLDLFDKCSAMALVRLVSSDYDSWTIQSVRDAMDRGDITYVGKYSEPDFELIAASDVDFIIENNMIYHSPSILEKLREMGYCVMIDRMSYESHPLGRAEWIRLIGLLTGHADEADAKFESLKTQFEASLAAQKSDKAVAFFYINSSGAAVIRMPNDYISKMIQLAGGNYVFSDVQTDGSTKATMTMELEAFYTSARDADILIYNNSIDSSLKSMDDLLAKSPLLANFKAVKSGDVWCTGENVYQQVTSVSDLMEDFHAVIFDETDGKDSLNCLTKLK